MSGRRRISLEDRFWEKVDRSGPVVVPALGPCHVWTAATDRKGYGRVRFPGRHDGAHRVAWILAEGFIPEGLHVLHRCDNPPCVRRSHLFLGTVADNVQDMISKGRGSPPPRTTGNAHWTRRSPDRILRGENHPTAVYSDAQRAAVLADRVAGLSYGQLVAKHGMSKTHVARLCRGGQ